MSLLERFIVKQSPIIREGLFPIVGCRGNKRKATVTIINEKGKSEDIKLGKEFNMENGLQLVGKQMYLTEYDGCYPMYNVKIK